MRYGVLRDHYLRVRGGSPGHRLVAHGAKLDGILGFRHRAGGRMLACGAVTHFAFDASMRTRRPFSVPFGMTRLAVCRPAELRHWVARHLDHGIPSVIAELVIGRIENVIPCGDREDQKCGKYE